jgi:hypothetical protein
LKVWAQATTFEKDSNSSSNKSKNWQMVLHLIRIDL